MQGSTVDINRTTTGNDTISSTDDGTPVPHPIELTLVQDGDSIIFGVRKSYSYLLFHKIASMKLAQEEPLVQREENFS